VSFTGPPTRRSFKEDREERRKRKAARTRTRIMVEIGILVVLAGVAWAVYTQAGIAAFISNWQRPTPKPAVAVHPFGTVRPPKRPKYALMPTATPEIAFTAAPAATATETPTPLPAATPTKPPKTPKPKVIAVLPKPKPIYTPVESTFDSPPTPAPIPTQALTSAATPAAAEPTPTPSEEVYAPQIVVDARFESRVQPEYPEIAREQGISGTAVVLVTVGPKGNVISQRLEKSAGHPLLDQAALTAAAHSLFLPPKIDGKPATETYRIVYAFTP